MKDTRRWGTGLIVAMLVLSMSASIAMGTTFGSRGGSDKPIDDGGGEGSGLIDGLGEPEGGGAGLPREHVEVSSPFQDCWKLRALILKWLGLDRQLSDRSALPRNGGGR